MKYLIVGLLLGCLLPTAAWARCVNATTCYNDDASASSPSLSGMNLLVSVAKNPGRKGIVIQAQDSAANCASGGGANGLIVVFDDGASGTPTVFTLTYASAKGASGGVIDMAGMPHAGRIRVYGTAGCQVGAAQW